MEKYPENSKITGKVSDIIPKGLRVSLEGGLEEFISLKYLERRGKKLKDLYKIGEEIELTIKKYNTKLRRIILTEKEIAKPLPKKKEELKPSPDKFPLGEIIGAQKQELDDSKKEEVK